MGVVGVWLSAAGVSDTARLRLLQRRDDADLLLDIDLHLLLRHPTVHMLEDGQRSL
jgi:hypothetical protein